MAKLERQIHGDFDTVLGQIHQAVIDSGVSADFEDGSEWSSNGVRCAVRVYERYSAIGGNRVSMNPSGGGRPSVPLRHHLWRQPGHVLQDQHLGGGRLSGLPAGLESLEQEKHYGIRKS